MFVPNSLFLFVGDNGHIMATGDGSGFTDATQFAVAGFLILYIPAYLYQFLDACSRLDDEITLLVAHVVAYLLSVREITQKVQEHDILEQNAVIVAPREQHRLAQTIINTVVFW